MPDALFSQSAEKLPRTYVDGLPFSQLKSYITSHGVKFSKFANKSSLLKLCKENNLYLDEKRLVAESGSLLALPKKKHFRTKSGNLATLVTAAEKDGEEHVMINYVNEQSKLKTYWRRRSSVEEHQEEAPKKEDARPPLMKRSVVYKMSYQDLKHYARSLGIPKKSLFTKEHIYRELSKRELFPDPPIKRATKKVERKIIRADARWSDTAEDRRASIAGVASLKSKFNKNWNPLEAGSADDTNWMMTPEEIEEFKKEKVGHDMVGAHDTFRALNRLSEEILGRFAELLEDVEDSHESFAFTGFVETHPFFEMYGYSSEDPLVNPYFYELDEVDETSDYFESSMCETEELNSDSEEDYFVDGPGLDFRTSSRSEELTVKIPLDSEQKRLSTGRITRSCDFSRRSISDRRNSRRASRRMSANVNLLSPTMASPIENQTSPVTSMIAPALLTSPWGVSRFPSLGPVIPESPRHTNVHSRRSFTFDEMAKDMPSSGGDFFPPDSPEVSPKASPKIIVNPPDSQSAKIPPSLWTLDSPPFGDEEDDDDSISKAQKSSKSSDSSDILSAPMSHSKEFTNTRFFVESKAELQQAMNFDSTIDLEALKQIIETKRKPAPLKIVVMQQELQQSINLESTIHLNSNWVMSDLESEDIDPTDSEETSLSDLAEHKNETIDNILTQLEGFTLSKIMHKERRPGNTSKDQSGSKRTLTPKLKENRLPTLSLKKQKKGFFASQNSIKDDLSGATKAGSANVRKSSTQKAKKDSQSTSKRAPRNVPITTRKRSSERSRSSENFKKRKKSSADDKKRKRTSRSRIEKQQSNKEKDSDENSSKKRSVERSSSDKGKKSLDVPELTAVPESPRGDKSELPTTPEEEKKSKKSRLQKMKPSERKKERERRAAIQAKKDRRKERAASESLTTISLPKKNKRTGSSLSRRSSSREVSRTIRSAARRSTSRDLSRTPDRERRKKRRKNSEPVLTTRRKEKLKKRKPRKLTADASMLTSAKKRTRRDNEVGVKQTVKNRKQSKITDEPVE